MADFLLVFAPFLLSAFFMPKVVDFCTSKQIIDEVNERSSHKTPTPRGGGIGFVALISILALGYINLVPTTYALYLNILLLSGLGVAAIGWIDDIKNLSAKTRLAGQGLFIAIALYFLPPVLGFLPLAAEKVLLFFAWLWFVNLYNFLDGIDGYAAMQGAFLSICLIAFAPFLKPVGAIMAGVLFGFLRVNWAPAKVFMGDVGSTYLGFVLAGLMLISLTPDNLFSYLTVTLLFTADATFTLLKRLVQRKPIFQAHREHFYQRLTQIGYSHSQVVTRAALLNLVLLIVAVTALVTGHAFAGFLAGIVLVWLAALWVRYQEGI